MTYQDYFRNSTFEDIWAVLKEVYLEPDELKVAYHTLYEALKTMPIMPEYSSETIKMTLDSDFEIKVEGAPDPQEWLVGKDVEIDFDDWMDDDDMEVRLPGKEKREMARESSTSTLAAHLLYWSTLYDIKTQREHQADFFAKQEPWTEEIYWNPGEMLKKISEELICIERMSFSRKLQKYWRETVLGASTVAWWMNLKILQKKIEYNIGKWRYVQSYVGWENDVHRMQTAVELLKIASSSFPQTYGKHINTRNAKRFTNISDNKPEFDDLDIKHLYKEKAYNIVWRWLDHNMKRWSV